MSKQNASTFFIFFVIFSFYVFGSCFFLIFLLSKKHTFCYISVTFICIGVPRRSKKFFSDRTKAHLTYLYQALSTKPSLQDQPISNYIASDSDTVSDKIKCKLVGIRHICKDSQLRHLLHGTLSYLRLTHKIFL